MGLLNIFAGKAKEIAGSVVDSFGNAIDKIFTNDEQRMKAQAMLDEIKLKAEAEVNRHIEVMKGQALELEKAYLADVQNARAMQIAALNQSDTFSKRFLYYLAIFIVISSVGFGFALFFVTIPEGNKRMIEMFADVYLFAGGMIVIQFFFGSSKSSYDKENVRNITDFSASAPKKP